MKRLFILAAAILATVYFTGCEKFLDIEPESSGIKIDDPNADSIYYTSASEIESALAGAYKDFKNEFFELDYYVNGDAQSDDAYAGADNPNNFQIDEYSIDALNGNVSRDWGYLYSTIGKVNLIINNVPEVHDTVMGAARKIEVIAEASFIRAYMYFQLVQLWGDVPLQLIDVKTISVELLDELYPILYPPRKPMAEVYAQIILDLETALDGVPAAAPDKGYASPGAVNALLAKVYATIEPHDWTKVNGYCDAVIALGYSLMPEYDQLWDNSQENCAESIFEINYTGGSSDGNWGAKMFRGADWKKFNIPSNDLVAAFEAEQDEIRLNSSIIFEDVSGQWSDAHWPSNNYPFLNKWRNFTEGSDQNYIFIRLADILLLKAEALNELGDVPGAEELVNQVRSRVDLPDTPAATQEAMRLAIEKERRLELAFEGHRWFDLKRTGRAIEVINNVKGEGGSDLGYNLTTEKLIWPIPQSEMDLNAQLVQNPGY